MSASWDWERIDPGKSNTSGDISKLFKNEQVKQPGILETGAPPADATILARESIQNSWDAGRALAKQLREEGEEAPEFEIRFVYRSLAGDDKDQMVHSLGLHQLAETARSASSRRSLGLGATDCLDHLEDDTPLGVLMIDESATTGMGGPWKEARSKLYLAMVSLGFTVKDAGSGGSYGYGKAGLIRGSRIHSVIAHTRFREDEREPGVTRRLLGMTYWGPHDGTTGFGRFGSRLGDSTEPYVNDEADGVARSIGMRDRTSDIVENLGSTFLLVDPSVGPESLCKAVERSWWPALEDGAFWVEIEKADGSRLYPKPKSDKVLATFIRAYELATTPQDNPLVNEAKKALGTYAPGHGKRRDLGDLGLVSDLGGWSYAQGGEVEDDAPVDHRSLIALVRGPRMVVEYYSRVTGQPYVRGAFVANDDIDELLRDTEPKAHDAWLDRLEEEGVDPDAPKVAGEVLRRIRNEVRNFKKTLRPPPQRQQDIRLPFLDRLMRDILEDKGSQNPPLPPADPRPVSIATRQEIEQASEMEIRLRAAVQVRLTDHHIEDSGTFAVRLRCVFDEDGSRGSDCPLDIESLPDGFVLTTRDKYGTVVTGRMTRDTVDIKVVSAPYDMDWTTQFIVTVDEVAEHEPQEHTR